MNFWLKNFIGVKKKLSKLLKQIRFLCLYIKIVIEFYRYISKNNFLHKRIDDLKELIFKVKIFSDAYR